MLWRGLGTSLIRQRQEGLGKWNGMEKSAANEHSSKRTEYRICLWLLTLAGFVIGIIRVAFTAPIDLTAGATFSVFTAPAFSRAFCNEQINHVLTLIIDIPLSYIFNGWTSVQNNKTNNGVLCHTQKFESELISNSIEVCYEEVDIEASKPAYDATIQALFRGCSNIMRTPSRAPKPLWLAYDSLRLASRLAVVSTVAYGLIIDVGVHVTRT